MSWVAVAVGGTALVGSIIGSNAASQAAGAAADASNNASNTQSLMYNQQRRDQQPWRDAGIGALNEMHSQEGDLNRSFGMSDFQADPGYQFRMDEANKAIERSAAARGGLNSGGTMKALTRYNSDYASNEFGKARDSFNNDRTNRFNRLASVAGIGQTATNNVGQAGQNMANNVGNYMQNAGQAQGAASIAQGNAINQGIGTGMNTWMNYQMMNRMFPQGGGGYGGGGGTSTGSSFMP